MVNFSRTNCYWATTRIMLMVTNRFYTMLKMRTKTRLNRTSRCSQILCIPPTIRRKNCRRKRRKRNMNRFMSLYVILWTVWPDIMKRWSSWVEVHYTVLERSWWRSLWVKSRGRILHLSVSDRWLRSRWVQTTMRSNRSSWFMIQY